MYSGHLDLATRSCIASITLFQKVQSSSTNDDAMQLQF